MRPASRRRSLPCVVSMATSRAIDPRSLWVFRRRGSWPATRLGFARASDRFSINASLFIDRGARAVCRRTLRRSPDQMWNRSCKLIDFSVLPVDDVVISISPPGRRWRSSRYVGCVACSDDMPMMTTRTTTMMMVVMTVYSQLVKSWCVAEFQSSEIISNFVYNLQTVYSSWC